jgi:hypothetical protein
MTEINTIFDGLDSREVDYVQARANAVSDAEALRVCGFSRGWLNSHDKDDLNDRAMAFKTDNVLKAQIILDQAVELAAKIKVEGLQSRNERIKQDSSFEIMDRRMGKPTQNVNQKREHSGSLDIVFGEPIPKRMKDED